MTPSEIERVALDIRSQTTLVGPPIPVFDIAESLKMRVEEADLGVGASGLLVIENGVAVIGYQKGQSKERQRFTVAHEIGHMVLHHERSDLFIDAEDFLAVYRRDDTRSRDNKQERDANTFAGALLMPKDMLDEMVADPSYQVELFDDSDWKKFADRFEVSTQALIIRMTKLGYFGPTY